MFDVSEGIVGGYKIEGTVKCNIEEQFRVVGIWFTDISSAVNRTSVKLSVYIGKEILLKDSVPSPWPLVTSASPYVYSMPLVYKLEISLYARLTQFQ